MKWFKTMTLMAMLALWLPATNHCRLEQIPGLSFLACGDHEEAAPRSAKECDSDGCAPVESGLYKTEDTNVDTVVPVFVAEVSLLTAIPVETRRRFFLPGFPTAVPSDLLGTWQFSFRTALPPRPPNPAS